MWLVFKTCSSVFQMGMCGQRAVQSSWNFWNSCMFLQKNTVEVFPPPKFFWLMNHMSFSILSPTTMWHRIQHSSGCGCWLIIFVLLGDFHKLWISLWAGKEGSWSASYNWHLLLLPANPGTLLQLTPSPHPPRAGALGGQRPWQDSTTTQGITIWALLQMPPFHSSFSPPTYCQIVENYQLSFSDSEKSPLF